MRRKVLVLCNTPTSAFFQVVSLTTNPDGTLLTTRNFGALVAPNSDGDEFSGSYSFDIVNASGASIGTGSGEISGKLIPHPLLP